MLEKRQTLTFSSFSDCARRMCHTTSFRLRPNVWLARFSIKAFVFWASEAQFPALNIGSTAERLAYRFSFYSSPTD